MLLLLLLLPLTLPLPPPPPPTGKLEPGVVRLSLTHRQTRAHNAAHRMGTRAELCRGVFWGHTAEARKRVACYGQTTGSDLA